MDDREQTQHPDIESLLKIPINVERLDAGDYAFLDRTDSPIGIERSEVNNLLQKLHSGELEDQLSRCVANFSTVILLVEGIFDSVGGYLATYRQYADGYRRIRTEPTIQYDSTMSLLARLQELGIEILWSPNFRCSMDTIRSIYKQRLKVEEAHTLFKRVRIPHLPVRATNNPTVPKLMVLCPRLPEKVAIKLTQKYGSIWEIIHTPEEELLKVEGFGKGLYKKLLESLTQ